MEYSKELTAIQMWLKSTAGLNSFKRGTNVNLSRPVVLFDVPGRGRARHLTRYSYVQTVTWPCTLYVDTLDEAVRYQEALVSDLEEACRRFGFDGGVLPMLALGRTDGRFFGSAGSMVYGCSPLLMGDSFDAILPKVHGKDESILETSYEFGAQVLDEVIQKNCLKEERKGDKK